MTHRYIGTKVITAWPQDKVIQPTADSEVNIDHGYAVKYEDGYISWSPQLAFATAYRLAEGDVQALTFGDALHFLKQGKAVSRAGWNGKGMYVFRIAPGQWTFTNGKNDNMPLLPFLALRTVDGKVVPWVPSINDCLSEDWSVL